MRLKRSRSAASFAGEIELDYWILFRSGNISEPIAVITAYEMADIVRQYQEKKFEAEEAIKGRKKKK